MKIKLIPEPKIHPNSYEIMKGRHLRKNAKGEIIETPAEAFYRVANAIAKEDGKYVKGKKSADKQIEKTTQEFYKVMALNQFFPGSRVLFEAGNPDGASGQLSSCFVLPLEDSLEEIFNTMKDAAIIQKNNGGTGFNYSHIRPKGDVVKGVSNVAAGPVHYVRSFSVTFDQILQGSKRGGGNMAILNVDHPDIFEFINLKGKDDSIRNFNISVGISNKFMEAVENDDTWDLINPRNSKVVRTVKAKELFDLICQKAWECADPGLFFLDHTQEANPTKPLGVIEATNPCGEEPLRAYESCNLGSINLKTHVKNGDIDWNMLAKSARTGIHFLENMIDASKFPLQRITDEVRKTRKLGLGIMGLGEALYQMGIPYNSEKAVKLARKVMGFIEDESIKESERLAKERGVFPGYKGSKWDEMGIKVRNATMTSIAPTGTLSLVANTSSGVEPLFSLVYERRAFYQDEGKEKEMKSLLYVNEIFEQAAKERGIYSEKLMQEISDNGGSVQGIDGVPKDLQKIFVTTHDIEPGWHVKMQAATQESVDAAVSKTINFKHDATVDEVREAYLLAWRLKCKGITIYRDGSKSFQVLSTSKTEYETEQDKEVSLSPNAMQVLEKRALLKDNDGNVIEKPAQLWRRIAKYIAQAGKQYKLSESEIKKDENQFFEVLNSTEFQSGGALIYAGMGKDALLSKCFVLPIEDSIDSIFSTLLKNVQVLRRGGGTGMNFSKIRSTYARVSSTGERPAGPIEYLKVYNRAQDTIIGRGGRHMGSMAILNIDHPDIEEFIKCKDDYSQISHYNISVGITDKFMKAVKEDGDWQLIDPHDHKVYKTIRARDLWNSIAEHAWLSGDPGLAFIEEMARKNTIPNVGEIVATNPCGEQPLIPYESCNLGNIDVSKMVAGFPYLENHGIVHKDLNEKSKLINWDRLEYVTRIGVKFLDSIIDVNNYPIPEIKENTLAGRNVGLGIMGLADLFVKLGISYHSEDAVKLSDKIMAFINKITHDESEKLGKQRGNFPAFKGSAWSKRGKKYMRNARTTTIAPTGTISIISDCHPGIEPIFALVYRRQNSMGGTDQIVVDKLFEQVAKTRGFYTEELMDKISEGKSLKHIDGIPDDVKEVFVTTHEIDPKQHVLIQAAFQKNVDSGVSKTINLPEHATVEEIKNVYQLAYDTGCKGITVFRDNAKAGALVVGKKSKGHNMSATKTAPSVTTTYTLGEPRPREMTTRGITTEVRTDQGVLFVTINEDSKGIAEVFLNIGKSGGYSSGFTEAIGRLISVSLRSGVKPEILIKQLKGIRTSTTTINKGMFVYSVPDAVAKVLEKYISAKGENLSLFENGDSQEKIADIEVVPVQEEVTTVEKQDEESHYSKENKMGDIMECPDCGSDLEYSEGCVICRSCGYSKCG